jgi:hypothetical protein
VVSLYLAVVRLRAFMRVETGDDSAVALDLAPSDQDSEVHTLLGDALLRAPGDGGHGGRDRR